jgi:spermidine/putrescine transport system substrate-binding protein
MTEHRDELHILAPRETKPKLDYLHREVQRAGGTRFTRREALGLAGLAILAAACGKTTTTSSGGTTPPGPASSTANPLTGKPLENHLEIYNWQEYDDPSTYTKFKQLPDEAKAGLTIHETYYASNDEMLAKLNAGAGTYDIIAPSQNAVAQLIEEKKLLALDAALLPNLSGLDPAFLKPAYDPTGQYHVIKDYGITMFYFNNTIITDDPKSMHDFYQLLPKYVSKGRTNLLEGAEEVVPLALMALGLDANTSSQSDFDQVKSFLLSIRKGVTTISSAYIDDATAGKIILGQGWNGDVRRIVQTRKKEGDITAVIPTEKSEIWADNWCVPANAPHPVAAHAWINWLLTPSTAVTEMNYHNYPIPIPEALNAMPTDLKNDPLFNVPKENSQNYQYILNVSPAVVQARTEITTEFQAAG